jgi:hypothetical protein
MLLVGSGGIWWDLVGSALAVGLSEKRNYLDISRRKSLAETRMQEVN